MCKGDAGVRFSAKQKRALETVSASHNGKHQPTVVSSADGAKILNELERTIEKYKNISNRANTFIGDVAKALGASRFGSGSEYATFEAMNGDVVTIRLANHNAHVSVLTIMARIMGCLPRCKDTNLKAIHNLPILVEFPHRVVYHDVKINLV